MVIQGNLKASHNLSEEEWTIFEAVKQGVLMPFRAAQETLEGENYVTISQVPKFMAGMRLTLEHHLDRSSDLDNPTKARHSCEELVHHLGQRLQHQVGKWI
jgi:hypothetical protein